MICFIIADVNKKDIRPKPDAINSFACLSLNFCPVPEGDQYVIFAVNGHVPGQAVPEVFVIFLDGLLFFKFLCKAQHLNLPDFSVLNRLNGLFVLCIGVLIAFIKPVRAFSPAGVDKAYSAFSLLKASSAAEYSLSV